ncbi:MAG: helicase associated domain-containing protein, partial [Betaproteobacteria bacterium]
TIGFVFDPREAAWQEMFMKLVAYRDEFGDCNVPQRFEADPELGAWCNTQRKAYKHNRLSPERIERLETIGFVFDPREAAWEEMFAKLVAFKDKYGNCDVPLRYEADPGLGWWCSRQRKAKKKDNLSRERMGRLQAIGFQW